MQYALLIYTKPGAQEALGAQEQEAVHREYMALRDVPGIVGGAALHPVETATTIRAAGEQLLITDGPFADTKEVFGGFYLLEADDLDRATEIAARLTRIPGPAHLRERAEAIDVRPIADSRAELDG